MFKSSVIKILLVFNLNLLPSYSFAQDLKYFSISFLGKQIGSLKLRDLTNGDRKVIHINGEISSSPFRIFNGKFDYKTVITDVTSESLRLRYESTVNATFKQRNIKYAIENGNLSAVNVFPKREQTKFTNPRQIDFEFIDPAYSIAKLFSSPCKNSFVIYDGRRVVDLISMKTSSKLDCRYLYKIRNGPGHLMPLNFKKFKIHTFFEEEENSLSKFIIVKTGPFKLIINQVP